MEGVTDLPAPTIQPPVPVTLDPSAVCRMDLAALAASAARGASASAISDGGTMDGSAIVWNLPAVSAKAVRSVSRSTVLPSTLDCDSVR